MERRLFCCLSFSLLIVLNSSLSAQPPYLADSSEKLAADSADTLPESLISTSSLSVPENESLEEKVRRLEAQLDQHLRQSKIDPYPLVDSPFPTQNVERGGLFGAIELTFLKPYLSGAPATFGIGTSRVIDANYSTGVRYILGYKNDSGLGVRARYWNYDTNSNFVAPFAPSRLGIHLDVADAEITLGQRLCNWDLEVSGGLRYGKLQYSNGTPTLFGVGGLTFEGVGPTAALSARRILGDSGLSLFGNIRGSMLMGHINNGSLLTNMPRTSIEDEIMTVAENQLGIAWTRSLTTVFQLEVRGAWETQFWMNSTLSNDTYGIGSNLALTGPTLAVELRY